MTTQPPQAPFHLHALLRREPPNVSRGATPHTGHDVARDAWRRYTGTALLWHASPQHDWRGVGDALGHPLHWHAYTCTMPHSGQLDGLLWVADLGSGLRAVALACAQWGRYGFAVCVLPPSSVRRVQEWSWAPAAGARAGVGLVDLAHAHAFVRPGNYAAVLAKVILPARRALGLWPNPPYDPRDFARNLRDAADRVSNPLQYGAGALSADPEGSYTILFRDSPAAPSTKEQTFRVRVEAGQGRHVAGRVLREGPLANVRFDGGGSATLVWIPEPGQPAGASVPVFGDHAGALAPADFALGEGQQHDPLWAGTLGGWWSPLPSGRVTVVCDFTPRVGRDTFEAALARWRADPAGWTERVAADCYHEMASGNRIAESLAVLLPD